MTDVVPANDRRARYEATAGQTVFDIDFPLNDATALAVYKNGEELIGGYAVNLDLLKITLTVGAAEDDIITLEGLTVPKRKTAYPLRGNLSTPLLNSDADTAVQIMQELRRDIDQGVSLAKDEVTGVSAILPRAVANTTIMWGPDADRLISGPTVEEIMTAADQAEIATAQAVIATEKAGLAADQVTLAENQVGLATAQVGLAAVQVGLAQGFAVAAQAAVGAVKVSANDTTPGILNGKLVAGKKIKFTENNNGGNETLTIDGVSRIASITSSATPAPNSDTTDQYNVTALAANTTFAAPTGTPVDGQELKIRIKDNGTARTLSFNNGAGGYRAGTDIPLPTTTVLSKTMYLGFLYNAADNKWDFVALLGNI